MASSEAGRSTENSSRPGASSATADRSRCSARRLLLNWWFTSMPSQVTLPFDAERSLAIATASNPRRAAVSNATHETICCDRDVAVERPGLVQRGESRVQRDACRSGAAGRLRQRCARSEGRPPPRTARARAPIGVRSPPRPPSPCLHRRERAYGGWRRLSTARGRSAGGPTGKLGRGSAGSLFM